MTAISTTEIQEEIIADFELFDDWTEKYQYIIEQGQKLPPFPMEEKTEQNLIKGCQSSVWILVKPEEDRLEMLADSDSSIVKGLAALLLRVLNSQKPEAISSVDLFFIEHTGLSGHLAPTRANGLAAMVKQIRLYALGYQHS